MSKNLDQALLAVRDWHTKQSEARSVPDLHHGQRVVELGGDGSHLIIASFQSTARGQYIARCLKIGSDKVLDIPVHYLKPANQKTIQ